MCRCLSDGNCFGRHASNVSSAQNSCIWLCTCVSAHAHLVNHQSQTYQNRGSGYLCFKCQLASCCTHVQLTVQSRSVALWHACRSWSPRPCTAMPNPPSAAWSHSKKETRNMVGQRWSRLPAQYRVQGLEGAQLPHSMCLTGMRRV